MNEIMQRTETAVTVAGDYNPFAAYGAKVASLGANYITFKNGEYLVGQTAEKLDDDIKMVALMDGFRIGWRRWANSQIAEDRTELLTDFKPPPARDTLGYYDESQWEKDDQGNVRDPWQLTNVVELVDNEGVHYTYAVSSRGGIGAMGDLCVEYGKAYRQKPGLSPIVQLGKSFYIHKKHGKTYVPVLTIVGWIAPGDIPTQQDREEGEAETVKLEPPKKPTRQTKF